MSDIVHVKGDIAQLSRQIEKWQGKVSALKEQRIKWTEAAIRVTLVHFCLCLARWLRVPSRRPAVLIVGPAAIGTLLAVIGYLLIATSAAILGFLGGSTAGMLILYPLIFQVTDKHLADQILKAVARAKLATVERRRAIDALSDAKRQLSSLIEERQQLIASGKLQRAALLERDWKALRGYDWEKYLVEVCSALGANVDRIGQTGDYGVDLIVEFGQKRIAIQAKGYDGANPVNLKAVQEAYAGMAHHGCNACAVITNTRFASSAKSLAESTSCTLIGEDEFPDFVMGKIRLDTPALGQPAGVIAGAQPISG